MDNVWKRIEKHGKRTAICFMKSDNLIEISYEEFADKIKKIWRFYEDKGVAGKKIGIMGKNSYEWLLVYFATVTSGCIAVPLDEKSVAHEYGELKKEVDFLILDKNLIPENEVEKDFGRYFEYFEDLLADIDDMDISKVQEKDIDNTDTSTILFTSGTTGKRKGVKITNDMRSFSSDSTVEMTGLDSGVKMYLILPLHSGYTLFMMEMCFNLGGQVFISDGPRHYAKELKMYNPTLIPTVPLEMEYFLNKYSKDRGYLGNNKPQLWSAGANLSEDIIKEFQKLDVVTATVYGTSEASMLALNFFYKDSGKLKSVGKAISCVEFCVADGELLVRGKSLCKGYINAESPFDNNGWLHLGDMGYIDDDGYIFINGRKKNVIIFSNAVNIYPELIEDIILSETDAIDEIVVAAEKDKESLFAEIYCKNKEEDAVENAISIYNSSVPVFKRINRILYRNEPFKRNALEKIVRN